MRNALMATTIAILPALAFAQTQQHTRTTTAARTTTTTATTAPPVATATAADGSAAKTTSTSTTVKTDHAGTVREAKKKIRIRTTTQPY